MSAKLRVGVVGSGFGGAVHVPAFSAHDAFEVVAIASPHSASRIASERGIPHAFASHEAMLAGVDLDVVSVASPPHTHRAAVMAALERGKHVLCEKPMARTVEEAEEMLAAAERVGTVCAIAHEFRYTSSRIAISELVTNGHLGALREIEVTFFSSALRRANTARDRSPWWFSKKLGGGIAQAVGSHMVDSANYLAGRAPIATHGFLRTANPQRVDKDGDFTSDVADGMFALLDYGDGLVARITIDATVRVESTTLAVHGEDRTAVATGDLVNATTFAIDENESDELELTAMRYAHLAAAHGNLPPFMALLDAFAATIHGARPMLPSFADGVATQRVLEAVGY